MLASVPPNLVQSIRAYRVAELQEEAARLGQHFLYAHCIAGATKQQVLGIISESWPFAKGLGHKFYGQRPPPTHTTPTTTQGPACCTTHRILYCNASTILNT